MEAAFTVCPTATSRALAPALVALLNRWMYGASALWGVFVATHLCMRLRMAPIPYFLGVALLCV
jgi:hypothetical protein